MTKLINVVSNYESANVIKGANVFISVEHARAILTRTELREDVSECIESLYNTTPTSKAKHVSESEVDSDKEMVVKSKDALVESYFEMRDLLRTIAKGVLYSGTAPETTLSDIRKDFSL